MIPRWIEHDGFVVADWADPSDFALPPWLAEHRAEGRWVAARFAWLNEPGHEEIGELLFRQLKERVGRKRATPYGSGD